ncbi:glutamine amidotransferase [Pseudoclavibacter sp. CFCC 14310]|nr:glutamine amidotransferase [Pseudoclavibacter sp. CFCC 14310]KAB1663836.1 glutamine amidotransferase [Pseudoclavibacter sp. CFCC 13611]
MRHAVAIRHVAFENLGVIEPVLRERGWNVEYVDAGIDEITSLDLLAPDLVVVLGGPIGVADTDAYPFLGDEQAAISARLRAGRPLIGICLGAQLIAHALGASVTPMPHKEIGYAPIELTALGRDSALRPLDGIPVLHWHGDEFAIPAGAEHLAVSEACSNQAFSVGRNVLALQFHLEADAAQIERWLIGHAHELVAEGLDPRSIRADAVAVGPALAAAARVVVETWLDRTEASV